MNRNSEAVYAIFWIWLTLVTGAVVLLYNEVFSVMWHLVAASTPLNDIVNSENFKQGIASGGTTFSVAEYTLRIVGGALLWWRFAKVVVLHGSPFPLGMSIEGGRQNGGTTGRPVTGIHIGDDNVYGNDYKGQFLYGAVFRAHPGSDKLARSRMEFLVLALPFKLTLLIHESRLFISKDGNESRAKQYRQVVDRYAKQSEDMTAERFRKELVKHVQRISQHVASEHATRRIDGLNWRFASIGRPTTGTISDDFGSRISFEYLRDEDKFMVKGASNGDEQTKVPSRGNLREIAKRHLQPLH